MHEVADLLSLLNARGATEIDHPGGTLLAHLVRVSHQLGRLSDEPQAQVPGLAHALYGTDGFPLALLDHSDRDVLRAMIGDRHEELVYLYAGCDRGRTWRPLASTRQIWSRFDGSCQRPAEDVLRAFTDLCMINELDVLDHSPTLVQQHLGAFETLFDSWRALASAAVMAQADTVLARLRSTVTPA